MTYAIRRYQRTENGMKSRLIIKTFRYSNDMHKFLNKDSNALEWSEVSASMPTKNGTYAFAGGEWHNVKLLDASILAHV